MEGDFPANFVCDAAVPRFGLPSCIPHSLIHSLQSPDCLYVLVDRSSTAVGSSGSIAMSIMTLHSATTEDPTVSFSDAMTTMEPTRSN